MIVASSFHPEQATAAVGGVCILQAINNVGAGDENRLYGGR